MKSGFTTTLSICLAVFVSAQPKIRQADWQQSCDYYINVSLDDKAHTLSGDARFVYTNNSSKHINQDVFSYLAQCIQGRFD